VDKNGFNPFGTNFDDDGWTNIDGVTRVLNYSLPISVEVLDTSESRHYDSWQTHDTGDRPGVAIFAPTEIKVFIGEYQAFHYDLIAILEAQGILTQQPGDFRAFSSDLGPVVCFRVYPDGTIEDWYGNNSSDWTDTVEIPRPPPEFESAVKSELQRVAPVMGPTQEDFKFGSSSPIDVLDLRDETDAGTTLQQGHNEYVKDNALDFQPMKGLYRPGPDSTRFRQYPVTAWYDRAAGDWHIALGRSDGFHHEMSDFLPSERERDFIAVVKGRFTPPNDLEFYTDEDLSEVIPEMVSALNQVIGSEPVDDFKFGSNEDVEIIDLTGIDDRFGGHDAFISEVGDEPSKQRSLDWPIIIIPVGHRWTGIEYKVFVGRENGFHSEIEEDPEFERRMYGFDVDVEQLDHIRYPSGRQYVEEDIQKDLDEFLGTTPGFKFGAAEQPEINVIDLIKESDYGSEHDDEGGGVSHPVFIYSDRYAPETWRGPNVEWKPAGMINLYVGAEGAYHTEMPMYWRSESKNLTGDAQCRYDGELWGSGLDNISESEKAACEAKLDEFFGAPKDFKFGADNKPFGTGWEAFDPQGGEGIVDHFLGDPDFSFSDTQTAQPVDSSQANAFAKDDELDAPIFANILRNWVNSFENENPSGIPNSDFLSGEKKSTSRIQKVLDKFRRKSEQVRVELDEEDLKFGACEECGFNHKPGPCPKSMGGPMIIPEEPTDISELKNLSEEGQGDDEGAKKKSRAVLSHVELLDLRGVEADPGYPSHGEYIESDQGNYDDPRLYKLYPVVAWDERRINPDATHGWSVAIGREDGFHDEMKNKLPDGVVNQYGSYDFFGRFSPPNDLAFYEEPSDDSFVPKDVKAEMITALNGLVGGGASEFHFGSSTELTPVWLDDDGRVVGTGRANKGIIIPREGDELGGYSLIVLPEQGQIWIGAVPDIHHVIIEKALREAGLEDAPRFSFWTRFDRLMPDWIDPDNQEAAALAPAVCDALGLPDYPLADLDDLRQGESASEDFHFGAAGSYRTRKGVTVFISQNGDHGTYHENRTPFIYWPSANALYVGLPGQYHEDLRGEFDIPRWDFQTNVAKGEYWQNQGTFSWFDAFPDLDNQGLTEPAPGVNDALRNIFPADEVLDEQEEDDFRFGASDELNTPKVVYIKFQPSDVHKSPELDAPWFYLPEDNAVYFGPPGGYHYEMLSQDSEFRNKFLNGDGASAITFWMKALQEGRFLSGRVTWPPNSHASGPPREDQKINFYGSPTPDQVEMINRALEQPEPQQPQGGEEFHFSKAGLSDKLKPFDWEESGL
jgi:hypothetical protein